MNGGVRISLLLVLLLAACTERRLWVRTEPAGALVKVNGDEIGRSPASWPFDHYGKVLIEVELEGHEPREKVLRLVSPWWQKPGADFFADVLAPATLRDDHEITLRLRPTPPRTDESTQRELEGVIERAAALRRRAEEDGE